MNACSPGGVLFHRYFEKYRYVGDMAGMAVHPPHDLQTCSVAKCTGVQFLYGDSVAAGPKLYSQQSSLVGTSSTRRLWVNDLCKSRKWPDTWGKYGLESPRVFTACGLP